MSVDGCPRNHGIIIPLYIYPDVDGVGGQAWSTVAEVAARIRRFPLS